MSITMALKLLIKVLIISIPFSHSFSRLELGRLRRLAQSPSSIGFKQVSSHCVFATSTETSLGTSDQKSRPLESPTSGTHPDQGHHVMKRGAGTLINRKIEDIFRVENLSNKDRISLLRDFIASSSGTMNNIHTVTLIHRCAKSKIDVTDVLPISVIIANFNRPNANHKEVWSPIEIAQALYGMKTMSPETTDIWSYCHEIESRIKKCTGEFSAQVIGNSLFGLQQFSCSSEPIRKIIAALTVAIEASSANMNGQEISNSLFGLRKMSSDTPEVRRLLLALAEKIGKSTNTINSQQGFGTSLNGLQGMSNQHPEVNILLHALLAKFKSTADEPVLSSITFGSAMMGMKLMNPTNSSEVKELIKLMTWKLERANCVLDPTSISSMLNGLSSMSDEDEDVRTLLSAIADLLEKSRLASSSLSLTASFFSNSLYGLKKVRGIYPESRKLISALAKLVNFNSDSSSSSGTGVKPFAGIDIARSLYGMQSINAGDCIEAQHIIDVLGDYASKSPTPYPARDLAMALYGLKSNKAEIPEIQRLIDTFASHINRLEQPFTPQAISMVMLGLQRMSAKSHPSVVRLLTAINGKIGALDTQACGNTVYGLQCMSSEEKEVRNLLVSLAHAIEACPGVMSPQEISNAFYGLQNMNSDHPEVILMVRALNNKLEAMGASVTLTSQGLGNAITGFQTMSNADSTEVDRSMGLLAAKVLSCESTMTPHDIGNALFGLQGITIGSPKVKALLGALLVKMKESEGIFSARDIGYALSGLSGLKEAGNPGIEVNELLKELNLKISMTEFGGQPHLLFLQFGKGIRVKSG